MAIDPDDGRHRTSSPHYSNFHHQPASTRPASVSSSNPHSPLPITHLERRIRQRASVACIGCRQKRWKCTKVEGDQVCQPCQSQGKDINECIYPPRGQPNPHREYRQPRQKASKEVINKQARARRRAIKSQDDRDDASFEEDWDNLPPMRDMIDGVRRFTEQYFQLGFIPKNQFIEQLDRDPASVNLFLLLSILSISARFTPGLVKRFGTGVKAADYFTQRASEKAIEELCRVPPTLQRCQAFYLLSVAQQGSGDKTASYMNMGHSISIATLMHLHREETYQVRDPTPEQIIYNESARRTIWMLHSQDSLHCGPCSPVRLSARDITALLPCDEDDFAAGREPRSRAALADTPPAILNPSLVCDPERSLFASLMQAHHLWGQVARKATSNGYSPTPWDEDSEFSLISKKLREWEKSLPESHAWGEIIFQRQRNSGQDLAYLGVTMMTRMCNIVARRPYLEDMIYAHQKPPAEQQYFRSMAHELFSNVQKLYHQVEAQFAGHTSDDGVGAQMASFCVYSCALFSAYLCKYPDICPTRNLQAEGQVQFSKTREILQKCQRFWPLASRWVDSLNTFITGVEVPEGWMADDKNVDHCVTKPSPNQQLPDHHPSSSFSSTTYSQASSIAEHPQQVSQQQYHHATSFTQSEPGFPLGHMQAMGDEPHMGQHVQHPMYMAPNHPQTTMPPVGQVNMMMAPFPPQLQVPMQMSYSFPTESPALPQGTVGLMPHFPAPYDPQSDGYELELQSVFGGTHWMAAGNLMTSDYGHTAY